MFEDVRHHYFPAQLTDEISVKAVTAADIQPVWSALSSRIFSSLTDLGAFTTPQTRLTAGQALRDVYATRHREYFVFYNSADEPIGWSNGEMLDGDTYFMTWSGLLPDYQNQGLYTAFLGRLMPYLNALGYERVASKHMVNNRQVLVAKLKAGFHITSVELDERWGAQVAVVYYFHQDRRQGFCDAFSLEPFASPPEYSVV